MSPTEGYNVSLGKAQSNPVSYLDLKETCEVGVVELEMPLVVELEEGGRVGVVLLEVDVVVLRLARRVPALLADVHL